MNKFYLVLGIAALSIFSYAQQQGMSLTGSRAGQQLASNGGGGGRTGSSFGSGHSSSLSHK
jgi:hypothetical protein